MTDQDTFKRRKLNVKADGTVEIKTNPEAEQEKEEKKPVDNTSLNKEIYHDGFIDIQGDDPNTLKIKLSRLIHVGDVVVLMEDFPEEFMFKGYVCTVAEVLNHSRNISECEYQIVFESVFRENDKSRDSIQSHPNFEFPSTDFSLFVRGDQITRLHHQDLRYRTFFI